MSDAGLVRVSDLLARVRRDAEAVLARVAAEVARRSGPEFGDVGLAKAQGFHNPVRFIAASTGGSRHDAARLIAVGHATAHRQAFGASDCRPGIRTSPPPCGRPHRHRGGIRDHGDARPRGAQRRADASRRRRVGARGTRVAGAARSPHARCARSRGPTRRRRRRTARGGAAAGAFAHDARRRPRHAPPARSARPRERGAREGRDRGARERRAARRASASSDEARHRRRPAHDSADPGRRARACSPGTRWAASRRSRRSPRPRWWCAWISRPSAAGSVMRASTASTNRSPPPPPDAWPPTPSSSPPSSAVASLPLDLGRAARLFSRAQRLALGERDGGCASCGQNIAYVEAHHIDWWQRDAGPTDLANGVLLCSFCHHMMHRDGWGIRATAGSVWFIPPPHVDPRQTPRLGGRARFELGNGA